MKSPTGQSPPRPPVEGEEQVLKDLNKDIERAARSHAERLNRHNSPRLADFQADDLAQEARVAVLGAVRENPERHEGYLRRVIRNAMLNAGRASKVAAGAVPFEEERSEAQHDAIDPLIWQSVREWLDAQPEQHQRVFQLVICDELTQREAAAELKVSQAMVSKIRAALLAKAAAELGHLIR